MKIFISWSGERSKQFVGAIYWWLPKLLNPALARKLEIQTYILKPTSPRLQRRKFIGQTEG